MIEKKVVLEYYYYRVSRMSNTTVKTLYDKLLDTNGDYEQISKIHNDVSTYLKETHGSGYYVTPLTPKTVLFGKYFEQEKIYTSEIYSLKELDSNASFKAIEYNKESLATVVLLAHCGVLERIGSNLTIELINHMKDNLDDYLYVVKEDDRNYYRSILKEDGKAYYHDYILKNNKSDVSSDKSSSVMKTKSTSYSGLGGVDQDSKANRGNATIYVLVGISLSLALIASLLFFMSNYS